MNDLNTLMHAAVDDSRLDVDRLVAVSVREGTRVRRRRRIGFAGAGLAALGIVAVGATAFGGLGGTQVREVAPAAHAAPRTTPAENDPTPGTLRAGQILDLGRGVTGTIVACGPGKLDRIGGGPSCSLPAGYAEVGSSTLPGAGTGLAVVLSGPAPGVDALWANGFQSPQLDGVQGLTYALEADSPLLDAAYQGQGVTIHLPGWRQVGEVADDKQSLTGPDGAVADIVWRPASDYATWIAGEKNDPSTWTSAVHGDVFVTIQSGSHTTNADIAALGASLTWN